MTPLRRPRPLIHDRRSPWRANNRTHLRCDLRSRSIMGRRRERKNSAFYTGQGVAAHRLIHPLMNIQS
ncbi:hypothetical protein TcasGA2_TC012441 [Tribolium castaneum]|uniref:Uncharacterized protein n=1 Tax=Tribolium castaneum TaxID=7070 RepID=D6X2B6_TRICA|nr:hypothetical protein TcasGA2_TC012441 [Tribolium castaneum]